jgi:tetratricopeptide (TPR) repeat protein
VRDYAKELVGHDEEEVARRAALNRLLDFYLHTAGNASKVMSNYSHRLALADSAEHYPIAFTERGEALAWCDAELANLMAAGRATEDYDGHAYARLQAPNLWSYLDMRKFYPEWIELQKIAVRSAKRFHDLAEVSRPLQGLAAVYLDLGRLDDAILVANEALEIRVETGDRRGEAATLQMLGMIRSRLGEPDTAIEHLLAARVILVEMGHYEYESMVLNSLANVYLKLDDHALAIEMCLEALEVIAVAENLIFECRFLDTLGQAYAGNGDHAKAIAAYEESVEKAGISRDHSTEGIALHNLGSLFADLGDTRRAESTWRRSLAVFEQLGHADAEKVRARLDGSSRSGVAR